MSHFFTLGLSASRAPAEWPCVQWPLGALRAALIINDGLLYNYVVAYDLPRIVAAKCLKRV